MADEVDPPVVEEDEDADLEESEEEQSIAPADLGPIARATVSVVMSGYTYGQTPSAPSVTPDTAVADSPSITYYYSTTNSNTNGDVWDVDNPPVLEPGTYYLYAEIGETESYLSATTEPTEFIINRFQSAVYFHEGLSGTTDVTIKGAVTWDPDKGAAKFLGVGNPGSSTYQGSQQDGFSAFASLGGNPLTLIGVTKDTGFTISYDAIITADCPMWARFFDFALDGSNFFFVNAGNKNADYSVQFGYPHGVLEVCYAWNGTQSNSDPYHNLSSANFNTLSSSLIDGNFHHYDFVVAPGGNSTLYVDNVPVTWRTADGYIVDNMLNSINSINKYYIGRSAISDWDGCFNGWIKDFTITNGTTKGTYDGSATKYNLSYETFGGSAIASATVSALPNTLPTPTRNGDVFDGWYYDRDFRNPAVAGATLTDTTTLYAKWKVHNLVFETSGSVITAYCSTDGHCSCTVDNKARLEIVAPGANNLIYNGIKKSCSFNSSEVTDWKTKTGLGNPPGFTYYTDSSFTNKTTASDSGAAYDGAAPVKPGTYYAVAVIERNTISKQFEITARPDVTLDDQDNPVSMPTVGSITNITDKVKYNHLKPMLDSSNLYQAIPRSTDEQQKGVWVWLQVEKLAENAVAPADKVILDNNIESDENVAAYIDIKMFKQIAGESKIQIDETYAPVIVRLEVPTEVRRSGRTFKVVRVHNGVFASITEYTAPAVDGTLTFQSDKFSTYGLLYKDPPAPPPGGGGGGSGGSSGGSSGSSSSGSTVVTNPANAILVENLAAIPAGSDISIYLGGKKVTPPKTGDPTPQIPTLEQIVMWININKEEDEE